MRVVLHQPIMWLEKLQPLQARLTRTGARPHATTRWLCRRSVSVLHLPNGSSDLTPIKMYGTSVLNAQVQNN